MNGSEILLKAIQTGVILGPKTFARMPADETLNGRDVPAFEDQWLGVFDKLKDTHLTEMEETALGKLREIAFKTAFHSCGNADLSAYISDDFEILGKGYASHVENDFLAALLKAYLENKIPHGALSHSQTSLSALIDELRLK